MVVKAVLLQAILPPPPTRTVLITFCSHHHRKTKIAGFQSSMTGLATAHITERERETKSRQFLAAQSARDCRLLFSAENRPT